MLEGLDFTHFLLQPMDQGAARTAENVQRGGRLLPRPSEMAPEHPGT